MRGVKGSFRRGFLAAVNIGCRPGWKGCYIGRRRAFPFIGTGSSLAIFISFLPIAAAGGRTSWM
jgi:hypothetical protein